MRNRLKLLVSVFVVLFGFQACDNDDFSNIPDAAKQAFDKKYPNTSVHEWDFDNGYYVAEFNNGGYEAESWFSTSGAWVMTETDVPFRDLPSAVQTAFNQSEYANWQIEDVDRLEREGLETVYVIEVESGELEYDLYFSESGILVKAVNSGGNTGAGDYLPSLSDDLKSKVQEMYPNARIVDMDVEGLYIEIDIIHENRAKDVRFDANGTWLSTSWDVPFSQLPTAVSNALAASEYASYRIDDIDFYETPDTSYYSIELEQGNIDVTVRILETGEFL